MYINVQYIHINIKSHSIHNVLLIFFIVQILCSRDETLIKYWIEIRSSTGKQNWTLNFMLMIFEWCMTYNLSFELGIVFIFTLPFLSRTCLLKETAIILAENRMIVDQSKEDDSFELLNMILKTVTTMDTRMQK